MPFPPKVAEIVNELKPEGESLPQDLARFIRRRYGVEIPLDAWPADAIPAHLRPRVEVIGHDQKTMGAGRDLAVLRQKLEQTKVQPVPDDSAWSRAAQQWERTGITSWNFGDLPPRVTVAENGPVPVYAWPGLQLEKDSVSLLLFRSEDLCRRASLGGIQKLVELALAKDFAWLQRDLRDLSRLASLSANLCPLDELTATAFDNLRRHVLPTESFSSLTGANFHAAVEKTRSQLPGLATQLVDHLVAILKLWQEIQKRCGPAKVLPAAKSKVISDFSQLTIATKETLKPANIWAAELEALLPRRFLETIPFDRLTHLPRYLKALATRMERASLNPLKDKERAQQLETYLAALKTADANPLRSAEAKQQLETFRWMVEEFKVSLFAQELGTAIPVSPARLDQQLQRIRD
jgi:ATP-dependent helicase HrpA